MRQSRTRVIVLWRAAWILSAVIIGCGRSSEPAVSCVGADNASTAKTLVGVIRFDTWPSTGVLADQNVRQLDPLQWHYRLPFFGSAIDGARVSMNEGTQAVIDQELAYAVNAGINFWCFNHQITLMKDGINYYRSSTSPNKPLVKVCTQEGALFQARIDDTIAFMNAERANWLTVLGGRPVFFIQSWMGFITASDVTNLRNTVMANGFANPYLICENNTPAMALADKTAYGCDAIGGYAMGYYGRGTPSGLPYSDLVANTQADWDAYKSTGQKVVPTVMTGWSPHPDPAHLSWPMWFDAQPSEIAAHLQAALNWVAANPTVDETGLIQIYAWNEIVEGGWLLPSNPVTNPVGTGRLDAIGAVLCTRRPRGQPGVLFFAAASSVLRQMKNSRHPQTGLACRPRSLGCA